MTIRVYLHDLQHDRQTNPFYKDFSTICGKCWKQSEMQKWLKATQCANSLSLLTMPVNLLLINLIRHKKIKCVKETNKNLFYQK